MDIPLSTVIGNAVNVSGGVLGSVFYQSAPNVTVALAPNTTAAKQFFSQTGTGAVSAAPAWVTLVKGDVGLGNVDNTSDVNKPISTATQTALDLKVSTSLLGANSGVATLDSSGKVLTSQLPSYVDDVLEYADFASLPGTGETSKLYITLDTNGTYRWTGSIYVQIGSSSGNADTATKWFTARTITLTGKAAGSASFDGSADFNLNVTALTVTKSDVGLGNVDNTSDVDKPVSTAQQTALDLKLNSSTYTAADILAKLLTVDGPASGLDADLLDGQTGTYYSNLVNATGTLPTASFPAMTGDVTNSAGSVATTIAAGVVTLAKMANLATASFIGRNTAGTGVPESLSVATVRTMLSIGNVENTALSTWTGSANITTVGTISTGTWNGTIIADGKIAAALTGKTYNGLTLTALAVGFTIAGGTTSKTLTVALDASVAGTNTGDQTITLTGDVGGSGTGSFAATIAANAVTVGKMQQIATASFLGRVTAATGNVEVLTASQVKTALGLTKADVGLSNVDNTSDAAKPVSTAQQTALDLKLNSSVYTAADVLAKLITVDGSTSGLDADLLDGQNGSYYSDLANATGNLAAARLPAFSGDISTSAGSTVTAIGANKVTLAMQAQITTNSFLGRITAATGNVEVLSAANVKTILSIGNVENTALSTWAGSGNIATVGTITSGTWNGTAIASANIAAALTGKTYNGLTLTAAAVGFTISGGTTSKTLTVALDASVSGTNTGDQTITLTGDVTGSGTGSFAATIAANAVTLAKMAQVATATFLGRTTAATGNVEALTVAQAKTLLALAKVDVGLGNVDNTSDVNKPVSTAQQTALDLKANLASPTFTGVPLAPTAAPGTNTTQLATTAFVTAAIAAGGGGSGGMTVTTVNSANVNPLVDKTIYIFETGGVARTGTLPATCPAGFQIVINASGGQVTILSNGNTIDGVGAGNDLVLENGNSVTLVCKATGQLEILAGSIPGPAGFGIPEGGTVNQVLTKLSATDYDVGWALSFQYLDGTFGDITISASTTVHTINNNAVTLAKFQQITTASFLGRNTAATGNVEVLSVATVKTMLALAKADVGLGNVDNTSDATKFTNPALTGTPTAPTATLGTNTTQIATTAFVVAGDALQKSRDPGLQSQTTATTLTLASDTQDLLVSNGATAGITIANPTGTPAWGRKIEYRIKTAANQTVGFGANFRSTGVNALPTTTVAGKWLRMGFEWNASDSKWDLIALLQDT